MHMLSHYKTHMDESLQYLRDAIEVSFRNLCSPRSIFLQNNVITTDYESQKLHYFRYYVEAVHSKGSFTSYSANRLEILHKPLKRAGLAPSRLRVHAAELVAHTLCPSLAETHEMCDTSSAAWTPSRLGANPANVCINGATGRRKKRIGSSSENKLHWWNFRI